MKKYLLHILLLCTLSGFSQIAKYNHFPTMKPHHILDAKLDDISFAYSMRLLESDYEGPIIRLRYTTYTLFLFPTNHYQDFSWGENDIVDIVAINAWRNGNDVFVHTWYDQSGQGRDAVQATLDKQPQFYPDASNPYFEGDGNNDCLTIDTPNGVQDVTNAGKEETVITVMRATNRNQHSFGVLTSSDRWSVHINWRDGNLYFDPGYCCNSTRSFSNNGNVNTWENYSFIRTSTNVIARSGGTQRFNGTHTTGRCTRTEDFAIGWATGNGPTYYSSTGFNEFIMYKTDIITTQVQEIEKNSITFWNLYFFYYEETNITIFVHHYVT